MGTKITPARIQEALDNLSSAMLGEPGHFQVRGGADSSSWHAVLTTPGDEIPIDETRISPLLGLRELEVWIQGYFAGFKTGSGEPGDEKDETEATNPEPEGD